MGMSNWILDNEDKFWDIITIAKPHHVKKLDIFLQQIKTD